MKCDICKKRDATVHLTEIINDKVTKLHICEACAREKGEEMETHFGLSDLLAGLADFGVQHESTGHESVQKCSVCGINFMEFQRSGRLGCPKCYDAFQAQLSTLLKRIHGSDRHMGKLQVKKVKGKKKEDVNIKELQDLKMKMQKAISIEAFEEAAILRDKIKKFESRLGNE